MCVSGKIRYSTRRRARRVARLQRAHDHGVRPYWCEECRGWHNGHLPAVVRHGDLSAGALYR